MSGVARHEKTSLSEVVELDPMQYMLFGLTRVCSSDSLSNGSAVFAQLAVVPNTQTDICRQIRVTLVATGRL